VVLTQSFKLVSFLHLYLLFYGRWYMNVLAIVLLDGVMIIISYRLPTISLSLSIWSQFANFRYHGDRGWTQTNFT